jgi:hypothetical protein
MMAFNKINTVQNSLEYVDSSNPPLYNPSKEPQRAASSNFLTNEFYAKAVTPPPLGAKINSKDLNFIVSGQLIV